MLHFEWHLITGKIPLNLRLTDFEKECCVIQRYMYGFSAGGFNKLPFGVLKVR